MEGAQHETCRIIVQRRISEASRQISGQNNTILDLQKTVDLLTDRLKQQLNTALAMQEETLRQKDLMVHECKMLRQHLSKLEGTEHSQLRQAQSMCEDLQRERDKLIGDRDKLRVEVTELRRHHYGPDNDENLLYEELDLTLQRDVGDIGQGLGIGVWGGHDVCCTPGDPSIYVTKVMPGSAAERYGIKINDIMLKVNNMDLSDVQHSRAVDALKQCTTCTRLLIKRKKDNHCTVKLTKGSAGYGVSLSDQPSGCVVTMVTASGVDLHQNDIIIAINGISVVGLSVPVISDMLDRTSTTCLLIINKRARHYTFNSPERHRTLLPSLQTPFSNTFKLEDHQSPVFGQSRVSSEEENNQAEDMTNYQVDDVANNLDDLGTLQKDRDLRQKKLWYSPIETSPDIKKDSDSKCLKRQSMSTMNLIAMNSTENILECSIITELDSNQQKKEVLNNKRSEDSSGFQNNNCLSDVSNRQSIVENASSPTDNTSSDDECKNEALSQNFGANTKGWCNSASVENIPLRVNSNAPKRSQSVGQMLHRDKSRSCRDNNNIMQTVDVDGDTRHHRADTTPRIAENPTEEFCDSNLRAYTEDNHDYPITSPTVSRDESCFTTVGSFIDSEGPTPRESSPNDNNSENSPSTETTQSSKLHRKKYEPKSIARWPSDKRFSQIKSDLFSQSIQSVQSDMTITFPINNDGSDTTFPVSNDTTFPVSNDGNNTTFPVTSCHIRPEMIDSPASPDHLASEENNNKLLPNDPPQLELLSSPKTLNLDTPPKRVKPARPEKIPAMERFMNCSSPVKEYPDPKSINSSTTTLQEKPESENPEVSKTIAPQKPPHILSPKNRPLSPNPRPLSPRPLSPRPLSPHSDPPPLKNTTTFPARIPPKITNTEPVKLDLSLTSDNKDKTDVMEEWERRTEMKRKIENKQAEEALHIISGTNITPGRKISPGTNLTTGSSISALRRTLVYKRPTPTTSLGLSIVSSDSDRAGIFIAQLSSTCPDPISKVVKVGDQIIEVNSTDVTTATHAEFVKQITTQQDLSLVLQQNIARFGGVFQMARGGTFYLRALYDQDKTREEGLKFYSGNILHVLDKRKDDCDGWWLASLVGRSGQDIKCGLIPSRHRAERMLQEDEEEGEIANKPHRSRRNRRSTRMARQASAPDLTPNTTSTTILIPYERVIERKVQYTRPVVILGPLGDIVASRLRREHKDTFGTCKLHTNNESMIDREKYISCTREELTRPSKLNFVECKQIGDHLYYTSIDCIKEVAKQKKHCLLDVGITAIQRLHHAQLYPIVIFLKFASAEIILRQQGVSCNYEQAQTSLQRTEKLERDHSLIFTAVIEGEELSAMYELTKKAIRHNSGPILWVPQTSRAFL